MPLKVNVGLSKKIGMPRYGSLGAACHVELELAGDLLTNDCASFQRHVRGAYLACRQAVEEELARQGSSTAKGPNVKDGEPSKTNYGSMGQETANSNRSRCAAARDRGDDGSPREQAAIDEAADSPAEYPSDGAASLAASFKQLAYIRRLAGQTRGVGIRRLETVALRTFGQPLAELSFLDASNVIDALKAVKAGEIDIEAALGRAAA